MTSKATVSAPSNIAFIKYWGTIDLGNVLPYNPSISMTLSRCVSRTTVERLGNSEADRVWLASEAGDLDAAPEPFTRGVVSHLDRLREWAGVEDRFEVATRNSFPMGTGLASSASGFAALALATISALDRQVPEKEASILARLSGSGSAARSVLGGYVEWPARDADDGAAETLATAEHWGLRDVIAVLDSESKEVSSRQGHERAPSSPYFEPRLKILPQRLERVRAAIEQRDFSSIAPVVEEEAIDLHLIAMSSQPPIFYWQPATLEVLQRVRQMRSDGVEVCSTMDAGANVHLICTPDAESTVVSELRQISAMKSIIQDGVGNGPESLTEHLF